ncbi:hypothetical protein GEMRC1_003341 [Eukaryota sp. GEM-RC1]
MFQCHQCSLTSLPSDLPDDCCNIDASKNHLRDISILSRFHVLGLVDLSYNQLEICHLHCLSSSIILNLRLQGNFSLPPFAQLSHFLPSTWSLNGVYITLADRLSSFSPSVCVPLPTTTTPSLHNSLSSSFTSYRAGPPKNLKEDRARLSKLCLHYHPDVLSSFELFFKKLSYFERIDLCLIFGLIGRGVFSSSNVTTLLTLFCNDYSTLLHNVELFLYTFLCRSMKDSISTWTFSQYLGDDPSYQFLEFVTSTTIPSLSYSALLKSALERLLLLLRSKSSSPLLSESSFNSLYNETLLLVNPNANRSTSTKPLSSLFEPLPFDSMEVTGGRLSLGDVVMMARNSTAAVVLLFVHINGVNFVQLQVNDYETLIANKKTKLEFFILKLDNVRYFNGNFFVNEPIVSPTDSTHQSLVTVFTETSGLFPFTYLFSSNDFLKHLPGTWKSVGIDYDKKLTLQSLKKAKSKDSLNKQVGSGFFLTEQSTPSFTTSTANCSTPPARPSSRYKGSAKGSVKGKLMVRGVGSPGV